MELVASENCGAKLELLTMPMPLSVSELPDVIVKLYCGAVDVNRSVFALAAVSMVTELWTAEAPNVATVSAGVAAEAEGT